MLPSNTEFQVHGNKNQLATYFKTENYDGVHTLQLTNAEHTVN